jgi:predicted O-methyltransferase YrrM
MKLVKGLEPPFKPLLCQDAIDRFEELIDRDSVVFEYGSGASTLWLAARTFLTVSVEHDPEWYDEVTTRQEASNATVYLVQNHTAYVMMADEFPDRFFDVAFVDCLDKLRVHCIKAIIPKIKPCGWLVVDDTSWPMLKGAIGKTSGLARWEREDYKGVKYGRSDGKVVRGMTSFFQKPEG